MREAIEVRTETTKSSRKTGWKERSGGYTAFMFPGQGSQCLGMGKKVCDLSPRSKAVWDCASDISGIDVRKLCSKGPMKLLGLTRYQQVAVTTVNMACLSELTHYSSESADAVLGHSVGEYTALYCAGSMGMEDTFRAVDARARIMQKLSVLSDGGMAAVIGVSHEEMQRLLKQTEMTATITIANDNTPRQQVLSGPRKQLKILCRFLMGIGHRVVKLPVNGAWHSSSMSQGVDAMAAVLAEITLHPTKIPFIMNRVGRPVSDPALIRKYLCEQLSSRVLWTESVRFLGMLGVLRVFEVGSRKILSRMLNDFSFTETMIVSHVDETFRYKRLPLS